MSDLIIEGDNKEQDDIPSTDVVLTLEFPIKFTFRPKGGGPDRVEIIRELTVRRITAGDLEKIESHKSDMAKTRVLFMDLTGQPEHVFKRLDAEDLDAFSKITATFLPASQGNGANS